MARVSKTNPFTPRAQPESRSNTGGEKKDEEEEENSSSSSTTSSSDSEKDTVDKKQERAKGKRPMQAKKGKRTLYEMISGPERAKGTVTKRGRGKSMAYTARLWSKHNPRIDVYVSSDDEPKNADPKPRGTIDKGKRPMQARSRNQKTTVATRNVTKRGRGKSAAHTLRLWSKHNPRSPPKGSNVHFSSKFEPKNADPKVKQEDDVFQSSETDSEEVCKRSKVERHDDNDDANNDGRGAGAHRNLTSFDIEVVGK